MPSTSIGLSILRWLARILSVLLLAFTGMFAIGLFLAFIWMLAIGETHCDVLDVVRGTHGMCLIFPFGLCVGLLIAWRWELAGSLISLVCLAIFYAAEVHHHPGRWLREMGVLIFGMPALLFLASWAWTRLTSQRVHGTKGLVGHSESDSR